MLSNRIGAAVIGFLLSTPACAQQPPSAAQSGTGAQTTSPADVKKDQSAVLPSAGSGGPSAAPTMVRDCLKRPEDCTEAPSPGDKQTAKDDIKPR
jgi:hypothetical protein